MKVFLGWSGDRSFEIAQAFDEWLPKVIPAVKPFISSGIPKGKRWVDAIAEELKETKVGILCLTRDNLNSNWILFEAGALSKTEDAHVCTFLFDVKSTDIEEPLAAFQDTAFNKEDIHELLKTINNVVSESGENAISDSHLEIIFDKFWPKLKTKLDDIPEREPVGGKPLREERELLEETLDIVRELKAEKQQKEEESSKSRLKSLGTYYTPSFADSSANLISDDFLHEKSIEEMNKIQRKIDREIDREMRKMRVKDYMEWKRREEIKKNKKKDTDNSQESEE